MRATVDRRGFVSAVKTVMPAVSKSGHMPILSGIRIDVAPTGVDVTASRVDLTISTCVDAPGSTKGSAVVPAGLLLRVVAALAGEVVHLTLEDDRLIVSAGEAVASLPTYPVDDWPRLAEPAGEAVRLDEETVALIRRLVPFASVDREREQLVGVRFAGGFAAATDSYRLARLEGLDPALGPATIPAEALKAALVGEADVVMDERMCSISSGRTTTIVNLIAGEFPPYEGVIPQNPPLHITASTDALLDAVERVRSLGVDIDRGIQFDVEGDKLSLSTSSDELGSMSDVVAVDSDVEFPLQFNPAYLEQLLEAVEAPDVTIQVTDGLKPVLVRSGRLTLVQMPVRVKRP